MRLINTKTGRFQWFEDPRKVRYAILSHVWSEEGEQSFKDVQSLIDAAPTESSILDDPSLSHKIKSFCKVASERGFKFGWVDSCCIDKTSSSELSEAITSMYDWYRHADMCFALLHDVDSQKAGTAKERNQQFCGSQWFLRGWTLQELLAPSILLFLSNSWDVIGSKQTSAALVASITNIDKDVLTFKRSLDEVTVACRMSWAASRRTTREEDEAYCLMGIFGVSFPVIYGERRHAFVRLQEEIIRTIPDQTIFAWGHILDHRRLFEFERPNHSAIESIPTPHSTMQKPSASNQYLLASSPEDYLESSRIIPLSRDEFAQRVSIPPNFAYQVFTVTAHGIHVRLPLIAIKVEERHDYFPTHLALLACETQDDRHLLALLLRPNLGSAGSGFSVGAVVVNSTQTGLLGPEDLEDWHYRAVLLSLQDVQQSLQQNFVETANLYLPHRPLRGVSGTEGDHCILRRLQNPQDNLEIQLSGWSRTLLSLDESRLIGYDDRPMMLRARRLDLHLTPWFVIAYKGLHINIQMGRCKCRHGLHSKTGLLGALVWSPHASSSLEKRFEEKQHRLNHPVHLRSWAYRDGVASTDVELRPFSSLRELIVVHLTLSYPSDQTTHNVYQLGVEVTSGKAGVEPADLQARMRDRGRSATHDIAFPSTQEGRPWADAASYTLPDRLPVRDRVQSQTFSASSFNDAWILPSPPLTAANSKSSNHTSSGRSTHFSRLDHAELTQEHLKPSLWRSPSWDVQTRSFKGEVSRVQALHDGADESSIRARNESSAHQPKVSPLPQPTAVEGRGEMNQQSQSPQVFVDAHPSAECTSSYHLPQSSAGRSLPVLAGEEVWKSAAGRDGSGDDSGSARAAPSTSQAPNTTHMGNEAAQPDTAAPKGGIAKRAEGHGERQRSGDGTYKDTKRGSGSGFIMRGIRFFKRAGSSS